MDKPLITIAYRWALDETGRPVPIELAQRGHRYSCPLCHGTMIPRLGDQLQHHFAHELEIGCPPDAVTRAALARWIAIQLRQALAARQTIRLQWKCRCCGNVHTDDLLGNVSQVEESYFWGPQVADVAMSDAAGNVRGVILVQDSLIPTPETLRFFGDKDIFTLTIPATVMPADSNFSALISQGQVVGGPCPVLQQASNIIQEPDAIRQVLRDVVARWPGYFYAPVETVDGLANVVRIGNHALWLPPEHWREIIGGTRNPMGSGVNITMQTWAHSDGGQIWLYYVTARDTAAIGIKRYGPGSLPTASIDARFRNRHVTALDLVKYLVAQ